MYTVTIILSFTANQLLVLVDIVSSCVKDTVVLILDLFFFTERIVNLWNILPPDIVNFNSLSSFKRYIKLVNFSGFLKCFNHDVFFFLFMGIHKCCYPAWFVQFKCFMFYCYRCYCII